MKASEFLAQHAPTLQERHLDWITALKDETMSDVWEGTDDPQILIEILRCLLNPNYDSALNEYLRDALLIFESHCISEIYGSLVARAVNIVQQHIDAEIKDADLIKECAALSKEMRDVLNGGTTYRHKDLGLIEVPLTEKDGTAGTDKEKKAIFSASACINWLVSKSETSAIYAAYHASEHLVRIFDQDEAELSENLRGYVGNPFS